MSDEEKEYMTLEEVNKRLKKMSSSLTPKEADNKARINACKAIMKTGTLGFLLLCYSDDGGVRVVNNLYDPEMRRLILSVIREILLNTKAKDLQCVFPKDNE